MTQNMFVVAFAVALATTQASFASSCAAGEHAIGLACINPHTASVTSVGGRSEPSGAPVRLHGMNFTTELDGCETASVASHVSGPNLTVARQLKCTSTRYVRTTAPLLVVISETWSVGPEPPGLDAKSVLWEIEISSVETRYWTADVQSRYALPLNNDMLLWTGAAPAAGPEGRLDQSSSSLTPTPISALPSKPMAVPYSGRTVHLPVANSASAYKDRGDSWMVAANVDAIPYANSTIPGVHAPHGSTPNAMDCGTACKINQTCSVWTWSSETEHCWFAFDGASNTSAFLCCCCRQDHCIQLDGLCSKANALNGAGKWQPMNLAGRTSGCDPSRVHGCVTPPPAGPPPPWNGAGATTVPVTALLIPHEGYGVSVVQDPANHPLEAYLDRVWPQPLTWHRRWFRLGNGTKPVVLRQHLVWHAADWRPPLGFLRFVHAEFFEPDGRVNISLIDGGGAYADYRGENDTVGVVGDDGVLIGGPSALGDYADILDAMGFMVNWDSGEQMISHGQWVPYNLTTQQPFQGEWETCFAHPNFTAMNAHVPGSESLYPSVCWNCSLAAMNSYYADLKNFGYSTLTYGNYWEYGLNVKSTNSDLSTVCNPHLASRWSNGPRVLPAKDFGPRVRGMCDSNLFLREHLPSAPWRRWNNNGIETGTIIPAGMMGAAAMDAADPGYKKHLLTMVELLLSELPESEGVCFDGTGWGSYVNIAADDGRSFIEYWAEPLTHNEAATETPLLKGRAVRTQVMSMIEITEAIGEALHAGGKIQAHNSYAPRIDFWRNIDAVFSENGFRDDLMHHNSLLGIGGKPVIAWQPGCGRDPTFVQCPPKELWDWPSYDKMTPENAQAAQQRLFMRLLYYGNQPALPFPRNDHTITPWIAEQQGLMPLFRAYAPLFRRLRGREWVFAPHAALVTNGTAQTNLFSVEDGKVFVAPVVFAPRVSTVAVSLRGVDLPCITHVTGFDVAATDDASTAADGTFKLLASTMSATGTPLSARAVIEHVVVVNRRVDVVVRFGPAKATRVDDGEVEATGCALVVLQCEKGRK